MTRHWLLVINLICFSSVSARADADSPKFEKDILPIFTQYCFTCHGQSSAKLGLDLRTIGSAMRGSFNGPVIVKGKPEESLLYRQVESKKMPPAVYNQKLPEVHIETIKRWIAAGAPSEQPAGAIGKQAAEQRARFEKDILPVFSARCLKCHGESKPMAGLDLHSVASIIKGSVSGPVIKEGFSDRSVLVRKVSSHAMPPKGAGEPLSEAEIAVIREWIDRGHLDDGIEIDNPLDRPFTKAEAPAITDEQRQFWAFRKPAAAPVPKVNAANRVRTPVDSFLLAKLESKGLSYSSDAPNLSLMRRAYFDLIGTPPTPEETRAYLADTKPGAYERLLDKLLASPHYGERWGRYWLDAAGYVDTTGKDFDPAKTEFAEGMWHYRDYVIKAINEDRPWDRFLTEQIAGDELIDWREAKKFTPEMVELLTATGYMRSILDITDEDISNLPVERYEAMFKLIEKVSSSTLGLTIQCARCHTHKFDPIPQRDYYRFLALFATSFNPSSEWLQPKNHYLWAVSKEEKQEIDKYNEEIDRPVGDLTKQLNALRRPYEQRILDEKLKSLPENLREDTKAAIETSADKRDDVQKYLVKKFGASLKITDAELSKSFNDADKATAERLDSQIKKWNSYRRQVEKLQALWDVGAPPVIRLLQRGSAESPGPKVTPGFPEVLCTSGSADAQRPKDTQGKTSGRRLAFAEWLTSRDNPLAARVIVNRMWQHHFGTGIVATPDNFGKMGAAPANQELLDWLAVDFMEHGWKAKRLHKTIMLSTAYRQSAIEGQQPWLAQAKTADPDNHLLWRMNLHRLEAETLRDAVLAVSGKLDETIGGPPVQLSMRPDGLQVVSEKDSPGGQWRRSIYVAARRTYPLNFLGVFDYPVIDTNCTRRVPSATPLQSLTMMNDTFILDSAWLAAARANEMAGKDADASKRIENVYWLVFSRPPRKEEIQLAGEYLSKQRDLYMKANETQEMAAEKAFSSLTQMLLSSNEFLYVD